MFDPSKKIRLERERERERERETCSPATDWLGVGLSSSTKRNATTGIVSRDSCQVTSNEIHIRREKTKRKGRKNCHLLITLVAWRSGNALCRINEVALRRARLVLGWVTVYGQVNHLETKPAS